MKKIFTILSITAVSLVSAQTLAFPGSDFENWSAFTAGINSFGLKSYATQGIGKGVGGSNSLNLTGTPTANDYVFTSFAPADLPATINDITFWVKGTSAKSLSLNVYKTDGTYYIFNLGTQTANVTLSPVASNQYTGTIDTGGNWIKVVLNLSGITDLNRDTTKNFFALKAGSNSAYALDVDNFYVNGANLATVDFAKINSNFIKNTVVGESIAFAKNADIQIINAAGQVVKSAKVTEGSTLNVSSLVKGTYIVTGTVNGEKVSQKIIKK